MGGEGQLQVGLTLIELMVVIAMVAIVLAIGIPEYQNFTRSNTLLAEVHTLKGDIALARSEAATTGSNVVICPSGDPTSANPSCSGTNQWNTGWVVMAPTNSSCSDTSGAPFKVQGAFSSQNTVEFSPSSNAPTSLCFNRNGLPATSTTANTLSGMFVFNTPDNNADDRLCLAINGTGHMNILANGQSGCS
ncbi:GspH/FimT family pseudopilin [Acidithiobacillus sp. HP-11]|uniref:GspH/FimT family pseudopilin n=1 Tax=Acidithiobacillus sp. HP-11 TaxID=2697656 RepID=UPI00187A4070|nr:GspH/FimT family pseudopilin [Acidithiobacillus sp. HP-11]MBE7565944.1 GspH/FimT family pseudopilin [Acidithiobacillus sp. HP-11]